MSLDCRRFKRASHFRSSPEATRMLSGSERRHWPLGHVTELDYVCVYAQSLNRY
jgi:hypothetical protein